MLWWTEYDTIQPGPRSLCQDCEPACSAPNKAMGFPGALDAGQRDFSWIFQICKTWHVCISLIIVPESKSKGWHSALVRGFFVGLYLPTFQHFGPEMNRYPNHRDPMITNWSRKVGKVCLKGKLWLEFLRAKDLEKSSWCVTINCLEREMSCIAVRSIT